MPDLIHCWIVAPVKQVKGWRCWARNPRWFSCPLEAYLYSLRMEM